MATLFWGGDVFAPNAICQLPESEIEGEQYRNAEKRKIQPFLQEAHIEAFGYLADRIGPMGACMGFDVSFCCSVAVKGMLTPHSAASK
jgi:hypothetical protein